MIQKPRRSPFEESFLQRSTGHQSAAHEHVAHDELRAFLHEGLCGWRVKRAAAWDEAEALQAGAAGQSLKERRVCVQVRLL